MALVGMVSAVVELAAASTAASGGPHLGLARLAGPLGRMLVASVPAAAAAWAVCGLGSWAGGSSGLNIAILAGACLAAAGIYLVAAWSLGVRTELSAVMQKLRRRSG